MEVLPERAAAIGAEGAGEEHALSQAECLLAVRTGDDLVVGALGRCELRTAGDCLPSRG